MMIGVSIMSPSEAFLIASLSDGVYYAIYVLRGYGACPTTHKPTSLGSLGSSYYDGSDYSFGVFSLGDC
jgi:hypothetical protein